jgi:chaperonin cofactor prefoldin
METIWIARLEERVERLEREVQSLRRKIEEHEQYYDHITLSDVERWYKEAKIDD